LPEHAPIERPSDFARRTARLLTTRYVLAILTVGVLAAAGQLLVQLALSRQVHDASVINLAGRQRNYSQAMCKAVLATRSLDGLPADGSWQEAIDILGRWQRVHKGLISGDAELDLPLNSSAQVAETYAAMQPNFNALESRIAKAIAQRVLPADEVAELLTTQRSYLERMEAVVSQLDFEASARVHQTRVLEATLFGVLALVLVAEALLIFRPAVRRIRDEIAAREQAEQDAIEREVAEVSGRLERRIGQDLHDGLGQLLTGISFQSKALERRLGAADEAGAAADITAQVGQAIAQTRSLARLLHPVEADAESLGAALHELGAIAERVFRVQAVVQWDDDLPIPAISDEFDEGNDTPPSMHLYRIAQEALSNAIRHGGATHLWVTGTLEGREARLVIADDGKGFEPPSPEVMHQRRGGMGLRIMAHRAERMGATFTIQRRPEGGMRVVVEWQVGLRAY
jgi:signal transduction histidine kinase